MDSENLKKLMEHPVFISHEVNTKIIRIQLFFLSIAAITLTSSNITIAEGSSFFGVKLHGLTIEHIYMLLLCLIVYQIIHFIWASTESFLEWRLRQTALDTSSWGSVDLEITEKNQVQKVRQTTLYAYFFNIVGYKLIDLRKKIDDISLKEVEQTNSLIKDIKSAVEELEATIHGKRATDALWRFDHCFQMFCKTQNIRWLVLEFLLPIVLALTAAVMLLWAIYR